jgi:hypothetical protein
MCDSCGDTKQEEVHIDVEDNKYVDVDSLHKAPPVRLSVVYYNAAGPRNMSQSVRKSLFRNITVLLLTRLD